MGLGWKESGEKVKELKRAPTDDRVKGAPKRKDTKRWCAGHVGREHVKAWTATNWSLWRDKPSAMSYVLTCQTCGKHFDYCSPWRGLKGQFPCCCGKHS